jgi:alpha-N-arabinofuranosidase
MTTALLSAPNVRPAADAFATTPPSAPRTELVVSPHELGRISPYLFGSNLLWPYSAEGAFDTATDSFYPAFVDQVRQLGVTALRYPGGITSDSFDWLRAIGPQALREPNEPYGMQAGTLSNVCCTVDGPAPSTVGPSELGQLLDQTGDIGTVTVNFVTGTAQQAADLVAYMTAPASRRPSPDPRQPSYWAALRAANGHPAPYNVPYWEVGNEQDGPGQYGWRSGDLVTMGPHRTWCPPSQVAVCLYAFGGTTAFYDQAVGRSADERQSASFSTGLPGQSFFVYFPPVVPGTGAVYVAGRQWARVQSLAGTGPASHVYAFDPATGMITFGDGKHGAVPPLGARVTATYESGPHGGFVDFYNAMKRMDRHVHICEAEEASTAFLQAMGTTYPYDCIELHSYVQPLDTRAPMDQYEENLLGMTAAQGAMVSAMQAAVHHYAGWPVPIVLSEYGQLVTPMPAADPDFNLSLDEGLLVASQLRQWIDHDLPVAEKYLLNSTPFLGTDPISLSIDPVGLSVNSAMIAGPGPAFVLEPTGQVMRLMSHFAREQRLRALVVGNPMMEPAPGDRIPQLQSLAARRGRRLDLLVINASPERDVTTWVNLEGTVHNGYMSATLLDGPDALAYNTDYQPRAVTTRSTRVWVGERNFSWTFPAHSVTLLQLQTRRAHRPARPRASAKRLSRSPA